MVWSKRYLYNNLTVAILMSKLADTDVEGD